MAFEKAQPLREQVSPERCSAVWLSSCLAVWPFGRLAVSRHGMAWLFRPTVLVILALRCGMWLLLFPSGADCLKVALLEFAVLFGSNRLWFKLNIEGLNWIGLVYGIEIY